MKDLRVKRVNILNQMQKIEIKELRTKKGSDETDNETF